MTEHVHVSWAELLPHAESGCSADACGCVITIDRVMCARLLDVATAARVVLEQPDAARGELSDALKAIEGEMSRWDRALRGSAG